MESPSGDMMKDMVTPPASAKRELRSSGRTKFGMDRSRFRRGRHNSYSSSLQDDTSSLRESGLVPSLNVSELVLFEETQDENNKLTWDGKSGLVLEICVDLCVEGSTSCVT